MSGMTPAIHEIELHNRMQASAKARGQAVVSLPHQKLWGLLDSQHRIVATADSIWALAHHILPASEIK